MVVTPGWDHQVEEGQVFPSFMVVHMALHGQCAGSHLPRTGRVRSWSHYLQCCGDHAGEVGAGCAQLMESFHFAHLDQDSAKQEPEVKPSTSPSETMNSPQKNPTQADLPLPKATTTESPG